MNAISVENKKHGDVYTLPLAKYMSLCINCGGPIDDIRALNRNACEKCMNTPSIVKINTFAELMKYVRNPSERLKELIEMERFVNEFIEFFKACVGNDPWNLQVSWAYRIAQKQSFAMLAPTGVGKTTFGLVMALYLASRGNNGRERKRIYVVVPTSVLVEHYYKKLIEYMDRSGVVVNVIAIHSKIPAKKRVELENAVIQGDFDILITTSNYLQRNFDEVFKKFISNGHHFSLIFVDDVDAVMKGSKAIEYIIQLLGFSQEDIELGYKLASLRLRLARCEGEQKQENKHCQELLEEFKKEQRRILQKREKAGILIVSSATGRARGKRVKLFRELLGFVIGGGVEIYRNVLDAYIIPDSNQNVIDVLYTIVRRLGPGGLVFVPIDKGIEEAERIAQELRNRGIEADVVVSKKSKSLYDFMEGKLQVAVGVATYYGLLVRGIDLPDVIRYAVFVGVPRHKISLTKIEYSPSTLLRLLSALLEVVEDKEKQEILARITTLRRIIRRVSAARIQGIVQALETGQEVEEDIAKTIKSIHDYVAEILKRVDILERLRRSETLVIYEENGQLYMLLPDAPTYIQASGRTSRLYAGGITRGLSVVIVDDIRLLKGLERRLRMYIDDFKFYSFNEIPLDQELKRIDRDREIVKMLKQGKVSEEVKRKEELVKVVLFIVESPNKARTIASFFGRPSVRDYGVTKVYEVNIGKQHLLIVASGGHIFELVEEDLSQESIYGIEKHRINGITWFIPRYDYIKRCLNCGTQFVKGDRCPICGSTNIKSSKDVVEVLQRLAVEVDEVIIATDPDAEGEKIAYDLVVALAPYAKKIKRAEFHEVTRRAILAALENPRDININLVKAQLARRIEDRWLGFSLSEYVTKRYAELVGKEKLERRYSAGRVQTPVLGKIIELALMRALTLRKSRIVSLGRLEFEIPEEVINKLGLDKRNINVNNLRIVLRPLRTRVETIYPLPPFTTDELLAEAQRVLLISSVEAMRIAQELFELGLITYHRTDSTRISTVGVGVAKEYLTKILGTRAQEYFVPRTWGEGGAHEAIRPTKPIDVNELKEMITQGIIELPTQLSSRHFKLYDLIFRRFIASQMKPAIVERSIYEVEILYVGDPTPITLYKGLIDVVTNIIDPGFLMIYSTIPVINLPKHETIMIPTKVRAAEVSEVKLPTQGDIVRWMRRVEIGRPSTYAKIIETIQRRGYVVTIGKNIQYLVPSPHGILIYTFLAGDRLPEEKLDILSALTKYLSKYRFKLRLPSDLLQPDQIIKLIEYVITSSQKEIEILSTMVSVERTTELLKKMELIENGEVEYREVIEGVFNEICKYVLPLIYSIDYVNDVCMK